MAYLSAAIVLILMVSVSASCNYNPSDVSFETHSLEFSTDVNASETVFHTFIQASFSDCERECGLRQMCLAYTYHTAVHFCELHDTVVIDLLRARPAVVFRRMTQEIRNGILDKCGRRDCPVGTTCQCGAARTVCVITECRKPPKPDHVIILGNVFGIDSKISSICDQGYAPVTGVGETRVCQYDGTWSGTEPVCGKDCGPLTAPRNGTVVAHIRNAFPSLGRYYCDDGYILEGSSVVMCQEDGNWNDSMPYCRNINIVDCGRLDPPDHGTVDISSGTTVGETAAYTCHAGYDMDGPSVRSCSSTGTWTDFEPVCIIKDCGMLAAPDHGSVDTSSGTTFGEIASYACNIGFDVVGVMARLCLESGIWSHSAPVCHIKECGSLPAPDHGFVDTSSGTTFGETASYVCNNGYDLIGMATRSCLENGTWSELAPTCRIKDCGPLPTPDYGSVDTSSGTTFGETASYVCNDGYDLIGVATRSCLENGTWSEFVPTCSIKDCGPVPDVPDGQVTVTGTTFGETSTYSCNFTYELIGLTVRTCLSNGTWESIQPVCQRKEPTMYRTCNNDDDCWELNSECRSLKCGCQLGYSYLPGHGKCIENECTEYGTSFQEFDGFFLQEDSPYPFVISGYSLQQCKQACLDYESKRPGQQCLSAHYDADKTVCNLSKKSKTIQPDSVIPSRRRVTYLHRDCACVDVVGGSKCSGCGVRPPVPNATLTAITLPDGAMIGNEIGVRLEYVCDINHHMNGITTIESECDADGTWTNLDAKCLYKTHDYTSCQDVSECLEPNSECFTEDDTWSTCTCRIGFSYLPAEYRCVEVCNEYGDSFQEVENRYLYADPLISFDNYDSDQCSEACVLFGPKCRSANFHRVTRSCALFEDSAATLPGMLLSDARMYTYLHRDCACPPENRICTACDEIDPVENATLTEIILPEGAVRWTELDVSLTYTCKDNFHWLGSTAITRKCTEDGWTNYVASCLPETMFLPCSGNHNCNEEDSECRDANCGCKLGYSYLPASFACVTDCTTYGSTFQKFEGKQLFGSEIDALKNYMEEDCKMACVNAAAMYNVECLSFNYQSETFACTLNAGSAGTLPASVEDMGSPHFKYFHRDCASTNSLVSSM